MGLYEPSEFRIFPAISATPRRGAPRYATTGARRHASWILTTCSIHYLNIIGSSSCFGKTVYNLDDVVTRSYCTKKNTIMSIYVLLYHARGKLHIYGSRQFNCKKKIVRWSSNSLSMKIFHTDFWWAWWIFWRYHLVKNLQHDEINKLARNYF